VVTNNSGFILTQDRKQGEMMVDPPPLAYW